MQGLEFNTQYCPFTPQKESQKAIKKERNVLGVWYVAPLNGMQWKIQYINEKGFNCYLLPVFIE
jgi:hypothetical protein